MTAQRSTACETFQLARTSIYDLDLSMVTTGILEHAAQRSSTRKDRETDDGQQNTVSLSGQPAIVGKAAQRRSERVDSRDRGTSQTP